jgi:hypothetical protein
MTTMRELTAVIGHYLAQHNIDPKKGFTLILNFQDAMEASKFDMALNRELESYLVAAIGGVQKQRDISEFQMNGLKVRVESPVHEIKR